MEPMDTLGTIRETTITTVQTTIMARHTVISTNQSTTRAEAIMARIIASTPMERVQGPTEKAAHHVGSRRYPSGKKGNFQGSGASSKFLLSQAQSGIAPAGGGSGTAIIPTESMDTSSGGPTDPPTSI